MSDLSPLPGKGASDRYQAGRTFRKSSGGADVAYFERVRRGLPLPTVSGGIPKMVEGALWDGGSAE